MIPGVVIVTAVLWAMTLLGTQSRVEYILVGHIVMSIGFALLFTPLFTVSLSSVRPELYSHGSAVLGLAAASRGRGRCRVVHGVDDGADGAARGQRCRARRSAGGGIRAAFLCGAIIALFAVACAFFVRKPDAPAMPGAH